MEIVKTIDLKAPVSKVWKAITDYKQFGEWFRVNLEKPFAVGETAQGAILHPGYEHVIWKAKVVKIEPETLFAFTWHPYGIDKNLDYSKEEPTLCEFIFEPLSSGTRLTIRESGFEKVPESRRALAFRMNESGWEQQTKNIEAFVANK